MGNILTNDVVTNAINGISEIKNGSAVVDANKISGEISSQGGNISENFTSIEDSLTNKFDEIDYYEIPNAIDGGGFTPTPTATITPTPTPSSTPTPTPTPSPSP